MTGDQRIAPGSQREEYVARGVGGPLADRQQRGRAGQYSGCGQGEHVDQGVPDPAGVARVGDFGQTFEQAGEFVKSGRQLVAELVKSRRDR